MDLLHMDLHGSCGAWLSPSAGVTSVCPDISAGMSFFLSFQFFHFEGGGETRGTPPPPSYKRCRPRFLVLMKVFTHPQFAGGGDTATALTVWSVSVESCALLDQILVTWIRALPRDRSRRYRYRKLRRCGGIGGGEVLSGLQERIVHSGPKHIHELRYPRGQRSESAPDFRCRLVVIATPPPVLLNYRLIGCKWGRWSRVS